MGESMEQCDLSSLINALERGTNLHICVAFLNNYGNRKTQCLHSQVVHESPACLAAKNTQEGLADCYRCRKRVQDFVVSRRSSLGGYCTKGIYEYCRPVVYEDNVIAVIFVGNVYLGTKSQNEKLENSIGLDFVKTMEQSFSVEDCEKTADILESYIVFLLDKYGNQGESYNPLMENIKNYIRENMAYGFSIEDLAAAFSYNEKYLGRLFKHREGISIRDYCNLIRIKQAKRLLEDTDLSVSQIATQVGFNNITYFDRVFREIVLLSPRTYRTAVKKKSATEIS